MRTPEQKQKRKEQEKLRKLGLYTGKKTRSDYKGKDYKTKYNTEYMRQRRKEQPDKYDALADKKRQLKSTYGISWEQYIELLQATNGICPICQRELVSNPINTKKRGPKSLRCPVIDHNHKTGEIRGIICSSCNTAIGQLKEDIETLNRAIKWLGGK